MSWTDPAGWNDTTGHVATQADFDTYVKNNLSFLGAPPSCRVFNGSAQSVTAATFTAITFGSERYKTVGSMHSTSSNTSRLVAPFAGKYLVTGSLAWATSSVGMRGLYIQLNGTTLIATQEAPATGPSNLSVTTIWSLAANEFVELVGFQTTAGALNTTVVASYTPEFAMQWVGF